MKKIPKITVLASTVLLSTIFSPKAQADGGKVYTYDAKNDLEASENVYRYENTEEVQIDDGRKTSDQEESSPQVRTYSLVNEEKAPLEAKVMTRSSNPKSSVDSFELKDVYKYDDFDLDDSYIAKNSQASKNKNKSTPKKEEKKVQYKLVDKTSDGRYVLKTDGKNYYYYDNGKLMKNKDTVLNGKFYSLDSKGVATVATNKWVNVNGVKYYANQYGYTQIGLKKIGNTTYHFEKNGKLSANKIVVSNDTFYRINSQGIAQCIKNEWIDYEGSIFYVDNKGGKAQGLTEISGKNYLFDDKGALLEDESVVYKADKFYKVDSKGQATMYTNTWVKYKDNDFYVNENGWRCQGITHIDGKVYNLTKNGKAKDYYAYSKKDNATYYFDSNGVGSLVSKGKPNKDLDLLLGWMYDGMNNDMTYSMTNLRTSASAADCSSAVFRSMIYAGFREEGSFIGNTETLFGLGKQGKVLKEIDESEIRYGDIFVAGVPGQSLGAGGHTGIIIDKNTIIHCNYTDDGISITPRKGRMGDASGYPVKYYRLVGASSRKLYI